MRSGTAISFFFFYFSALFVFAKPLQVEVKANSAILMNADTGALLYEKHPFAPVFPASTTKIATALFVLAEKQPDLNQKLRVSAESLRMKPLNKQGDFPPYWWYTDGTRMGLREGEILSLDALMHGMMMVSGNDAANVIAEGFSGSIPVFVEEMNQFLKKIGCQATHFMNPHGCHHPEHVTTAYDLCLMTKEALKIPKFREIVSKLSYLKPRTNKQGPVEIRHTNPLLKPGRLHYPKAIGVKTGFHLAAQNTLVAAAAHEGRTLIAAVMGTSNSADRYTDAIRLFEKAFSEVKEIRRLFGPENVFSRQISGAKSDLVAALERDLQISYFPAEEPNCRAFVFWENLSLPIRKGQLVGEVRIATEKGEIIGRGELFAKAEVKGTFFFVLKETMKKVMPLYLNPQRS
jgi:D-alanyl-D-alanine carboxypeptidase (penicillin-binding protein 5/6)